jgi:hypothetical protein
MTGLHAIIVCLNVQMGEKHNINLFYQSSQYQSILGRRVNRKKTTRKIKDDLSKVPRQMR